MYFKTVTRKNYVEVGKLIGLSASESVEAFLHRLQTEESFVVDLNTMARRVVKQKALEEDRETQTRPELRAATPSAGGPPEAP